MPSSALGRTLDKMTTNIANYQNTVNAMKVTSVIFCMVINMNVYMSCLCNLKHENITCLKTENK